MPTGNLPQQAKEIFQSAEANALKTTCKGREDKDACAAKIAWSAVKKKYKKVGDKWVRKSEALQEFSLHISKAWHDQSSDTYRWRAVASDTDEDFYNDSMSLELFQGFMNRIRSRETPPEKYRSNFWSGGLPYLSVAHYSDQNGEAVPGDVESIFVDGNRLKGKGIFFDSSLGRACFKSVSESLESDDPVRISIAFLDYKHRHKASDYVFERKSLEDVCPECVKEFKNGEFLSGKEYLDGHLIHLALTRVPVNDRTSVEVERAMTTQIDDAESIVGEEEAKKLDENEQAQVGKSLVVKSETEEPVEKTEVPIEEKSQHLTLSEYVEARKEVQRIGDLWHGLADVVYNIFETDQEVDKPEAIRSAIQEFREMLEMKALVTFKTEEEPKQQHPLDEAYAQLKSAYDQAVENPETAAQTIQENYNQFGEAITKSFNVPEPEGADDGEEVAVELEKVLSKTLQPMMDRLALLEQKLEQAPVPGNGVPQRRSIQLQPPQLQGVVPEQQKPIKKASSITQLVNRSVGLDANYLRPGGNYSAG